jgi:hypothetical protein
VVLGYQAAAMSIAGICHKVVSTVVAVNDILNKQPE